MIRVPLVGTVGRGGRSGTAASDHLSGATSRPPPSWLPGGSVCRAHGQGKAGAMGLILILLVIALILAGVGFAVHVLWIIAVIFFIAWLVGLVLGVGRKSKS
jgi:hypothetical protein